MLSKVILRDHEQNCWFEYQHPISVLHTVDPIDVVPMLAAIEERVNEEHLYAAGFVTYEAAAAFDHKLVTHPPLDLPLLCFGLFNSRTRLETLPQDSEGEVATWNFGVTEREYKKHITSLKKKIEAGDIYQVNYTSRIQSEGAVDLGTFSRIARNASYGAFVDGEDFTIVSASPELFFEKTGKQICCKPMKGTAPRGLSRSDDLERANWLRSSEKNRAENLMITDMVRNDLSRVAALNTVRVSDLFNVEQHPTVWQMTSKVTAQSDSSIVDLFTALFPGASITGAPKRASMEIINQVEHSAREIYTGAIGLIAPNCRALFNIAIRTAWTDKRSNTSRYGAGGGIVWDSEATEEYAELQSKTKILHERIPHFDLLETMRWTPEHGIYLQSRHLQRLLDSANYFAFPFDRHAIQQALSACVTNLSPQPQRLRLRLSKHGDIKIDSERLVLTERSERLALAARPMSAENILLYHKTTNREIYNDASASVPKDCEALLYNSEGFITESVIANVIYRLDGQLYTPPVCNGLLPGTLREELLTTGKVRTRPLHMEQLEQVDSWMLINALRGTRTAQLVL